MGTNGTNSAEITVIVPVYNVEQYVAQCIESLLMQTVPTNIIVIDDGSTDESGKICDQFSKYDNVIVKHIANGGVSKARNLGINMAKTQYISFVDADDYVMENHLECLFEMIKSEPHCLPVVGYTQDEFELGKNKESYIISKKRADIVFNHMLNYEGYDGYLWNKLFKRDILISNNIYFPEGIKIWEDMFFVEKYLKHINLVVENNSITYFYRPNNTGATYLLSKDKMKSKIEVTDKFLELSESEKSFFHKTVIRLKRVCIMEFLIRTKDFNNNYYQNLNTLIRDSKDITIKEYAKYCYITILYMIAKCSIVLRK